jgi:hypothetical protein
MFTRADFQVLLTTRPFVPFRLWLSDGGSVDVGSPEVALLGRRNAVIGLLDPDATDTAFDRWTIFWYMHVTRFEMLQPGAVPLPPTEGPAGSPAPTQA